MQSFMQKRMDMNLLKSNDLIYSERPPGFLNYVMSSPCFRIQKHHKAFSRVWQGM